MGYIRLGKLYRLHRPHGLEAAR